MSINKNKISSSCKDIFVNDILILVFMGVIGLITLIANPGYYSHDEWQRFDYYLNHGLKSYVFDYLKIHVGSSFGTPVRPVAFLVQGIHNLFFQSYPLVVHLISAANTILVSIALYLGCKHFGLHRRTALVAAVLFVISPLCTLATGWAAALMDQLYVSFGLLTFFLVNQYVFDRKRGLFTLLLIAIVGMAAVLSKETGIIFPATLLLLFVLMPEELLMRWRRLVVSSVVWLAPIFLYLLYRLSAIEASFSSVPEDPYAASLSNVARNIYVYWLYPFHPLINQANGWQFQQLWSLNLAFFIHCLLVIGLVLIYRWKAALLYIFFYFIFLIPVILLPQQGSHYLFASAMPLSVGVACLVTSSKSSLKVFGVVLVIILGIHGLRFQSEIYQHGHCMSRIAISLEANHASAGYPKDVYFSTDLNAPTHVLLGLIFGRDQVGDHSQVNLHAAMVNKPAPEGSVILNLNKHCLLSVMHKSLVKVEDFEPKYTKEGVIPNIQPNGGMGLWIRLSETKGMSDIQVLFNGERTISTIVGDKIITTSIPAEYLAKAGRYKVELNNIAANQLILVGEFDVMPSQLIGK